MGLRVRLLMSRVGRAVGSVEGDAVGETINRIDAVDNGVCTSSLGTYLLDFEYRLGKDNTDLNRSDGGISGVFALAMPMVRPKDWQWVRESGC